MKQLKEELVGIVAMFTDPENQPPQWPLSEAPRLVDEAIQRHVNRIIEGKEKLPGEVDRWYPAGEMSLEEWINEVICIAQPDVFIAVR